MTIATYPDATNTGVPAGTNLTEYTGPMTITQSGTVIDGMIINGPLRVMADDVVIKNCEITFNSAWGIDAEGAENITIQDSDIVGPGYSGDSNSAILGSGTFLRNDISKVQNGITLQGGASTVQGNYIHDLESSGSDPHYDGISVQGGQDGVLIEGNTILARDTSDIFINDDFGPVNDVHITNNFLGGTPGYNIYVNDATNVSITDNHLSKGGYGYYSVSNSSPTISGNTELPAGTSSSEVSGGEVGTELAPDDATSAGSIGSPATDTSEPTLENTSSSTGEEDSTTSGATTVPEVTSADELTGGSTSTDDATLGGSTDSPASDTSKPTVESTSSSIGEEDSTTSGGTTVPEVPSPDELTGGSTSTDDDGTSSGNESHNWLSGGGQWWEHSGHDDLVFDKLSNYVKKHDAIDTGRDANHTSTSNGKAADAHSWDEFSTGASADDANGHSSASGSPRHDATASDEGTAHQFDSFHNHHSLTNWDFFTA